MCDFFIIMQVLIWAMQVLSNVSLIETWAINIIYMNFRYWSFASLLYDQMHLSSIVIHLDALLKT